MFELLDTTKSKLVEVDVLSAKNRPVDANPGCQLRLSMDLTNHALAMFDGFLRSFLYTKNASSETPPQHALDGVDPVSDLPNLTAAARRIGRFSWDLELTGYTMEIAHGIGGPSNFVLADVKLDRFAIHPKEGGTITLDLVAEAVDVSKTLFGELASLKSRELDIVLIAPSVEPDLASPEPSKPKQTRKGKNQEAGEAFATAHAGE